MKITAQISAPPTVGPSWEERWEGPDNGLVLCWLTGIDKARREPALAEKALAGELPVLSWKGGTERPLKVKQKIGALNYLATWQGLRGEDLNIEQGKDVRMTCTRTGVSFVYTDDINRLGKADPTEEQ